MKSLTTVVDTVATLPKQAPRILYELNPINWYRNVVEDGRRYKIALENLKIESQKAKDEYQYKSKVLDAEKEAYIKKIDAQKEVCLREIEAREREYIASIEAQCQMFREQNALTGEVLAQHFKSLQKYEEQSDKIINNILENIKEFSPAILNSLVKMHKSLIGQVKMCYESMHRTLDTHSRNVSLQIESQKNLQKSLSDRSPQKSIKWGN